MTGSSSSGELGASEAIGLVFRIATVGLSLASAIMTATATQCRYDATGRPEATVSYSDYASFRYAAVADLVSAVLQGVAIWLEATGRKKAAKVVELIDKLVLALTSTSAALLLAADEITSCGPRRSGGPRRRRQQGSSRIRVASAVSLSGAIFASGSVYTRRAPEAVAAVVTALTSAPAKRRSSAPSEVDIEYPPPPPPPPPRTENPKSPKTTPPEPTTGPSSPAPPSPGCDGDPPKQPPPCPPPPPLTGCRTDFSLPPAVVPPWCRCPRLTIPCRCHNPELCSVFF